MKEIKIDGKTVQEMILANRILLYAWDAKSVTTSTTILDKNYTDLQYDISVTVKLKEWDV